MNIKSYKLSAVIPVGQYSNVQPTIEIEGATLEEANAVAMAHVKELFAKHSEVKLKENEISKAVSETVSLLSFNEDVTVSFDPKAHTYSHMGTKLEGATTFIKQFTGEFNAEMVAKNCEKSWGFPASDIAGMWNKNSEIAMEMGTLVHKALEYWTKYGHMGEKAMPKHPILKSIVEGFAGMTQNEKGEVHSEILVTDIKSGRCGQVDRLLVLDAEKKICRVQDYKINIESEEIAPKNKLKKPYEKLPANKLSKYALQMNFYAQMLEASGWTVEGIDVYVYEDIWKHYELDRIIV